MTIRLTPFRCLAAGLLLVAIAVAAGANKENKVQRYGAVIGVKPEKLEYYKELHA